MIASKQHIDEASVPTAHRSSDLYRVDDAVSGWLRKECQCGIVISVYLLPMQSRSKDERCLSNLLIAVLVNCDDVSTVQLISSARVPFWSSNLQICCHWIQVRRCAVSLCNRWNECRCNQLTNTGKSPPIKLLHASEVTSLRRCTKLYVQLTTCEAA